MTQRLMSTGIVMLNAQQFLQSHTLRHRGKSFFVRLAPNQKQRLVYENQQQLYIKMYVDVCKMAVIFIRF